MIGIEGVAVHVQRLDRVLHKGVLRECKVHRSSIEIALTPCKVSAKGYMLKIFLRVTFLFSIKKDSVQCAKVKYKSYSQPLSPVQGKDLVNPSIPLVSLGVHWKDWDINWGNTIGPKASGTSPV